MAVKVLEPSFAGDEENMQRFVRAMKTMLPIAVSDIHVHLEARHVEALFGKGHSLSKWRDLTIPGQFACYETVEVVGPQGRVGGAVVVGPPGTAPRWRFPWATSGLIAAARHIHMHPRDARDYGVADGQRVRVRVPGERGLVELLR